MASEKWRAAEYKHSVNAISDCVEKRWCFASLNAATAVSCRDCGHARKVFAFCELQDLMASGIFVLLVLTFIVRPAGPAFSGASGVWPPSATSPYFTLLLLQVGSSQHLVSSFLVMTKQHLHILRLRSPTVTLFVPCSPPCHINDTHPL